MRDMLDVKTLFLTCQVVAGCILGILTAVIMLLALGSYT